MIYFQQLQQSTLPNFLIIFFTHTFSGLVYWDKTAPLFHDHIHGIKEGIVADMTNGFIGASVALGVCLVIGVYSKKMMLIPLLLSWLFAIGFCVFLVLLYLVGMGGIWIGILSASADRIAGGLIVLLIIGGIVCLVYIGYFLVLYCFTRRKQAQNTQNRMEQALSDV